MKSSIDSVKSITIPMAFFLQSRKNTLKIYIEPQTSQRNPEKQEQKQEELS